MSTTDLLALREHRLFETASLDEARELISSVMQPHTLEGGRADRAHRATSHMDYVQCGRLGIGAIAFSRQARVSVPWLSNYHLFMYCESGTASARIDSAAATASADRGVFCRSGQEFVADLSPDCEQLVLRIGADAIRAHIGADHADLTNEFDFTQADAHPFKHLLRAYLGSPALVKLTHANRIVALEMERLFVELLFHVRIGQRPSPERRSVAPSVVRRAEEFIRANASAAVSLDDIALAAGVPARTLLSAFKKARQSSPMQCLRMHRLELARERLSVASNRDQVTSIAYDCGFVHLGRFSVAYREHFGETPFATLSRARRMSF